MSMTRNLDLMFAYIDDSSSKQWISIITYIMSGQGKVWKHFNMARVFGVCQGKMQPR